MVQDFLGFHLIDPFTTIEMFLATYHMPVNMVIGTITVLLFICLLEEELTVLGFVLMEY